MPKGDIKIKKKTGKEEWVTFEPQISRDKKTFVLRIESSIPENWYVFLLMMGSYATDEIEELEKRSLESPNQ